MEQQFETDLFQKNNKNNVMAVRCVDGPAV